MTKTKAFYLFLILPLIFGSLLMTGCVNDLNGDFTQDVTANFEEIECEDLDVEDLDLSPGFRGYHKESSGANSAEFSINNHDGKYDFPASLATDDCSGFCAFTVTFEPAPEVDPTSLSNLEINNIYISYMVGSTEVTALVDAYQWDCVGLELQVESLATNTISNYEIDFVGTDAAGLNVLDITITSGLCVVENIDLNDDPRMLTILTDRSQSN